MLRRIVCLIVLTVMFTAVPSRSEVFATVTGLVFTKEITYGYTGAVKEILLIVNTIDGNYWGVRCRQSESNLSKCNVIEEGDYIIANGQLLPTGGTAVGCGWLSPSAIVKQ